jgi:hypothetical protein
VEISLDIVKYINDPVYGGIGITRMEQKLIDTSVFQRLRKLRQLGRVNYVFPGAEHSRYVHSLGVLHIMGLMVKHLCQQGNFSEEDAVKMRAAALLHDIGHYPLSHLGESVYGYIKENDNADGILEPIQSEMVQKMTMKPLYEMASSNSKVAHHEYLGKYIVQHNSEISSILKSYGLDPLEIGEIFTGERGSRNMVYSQLLHSSLDADRLDYLLRDSYQTGVTYGLVDLQYLIRLLRVVEDEDLEQDDKHVLVCNKKGQHVVEHFLMSRYFHYSQVIFHKTNSSFEGLIRCLYIKLVQSGNFLYKSLEDIHDSVNDDKFLNFTDAFLEVAFDEYYKETNDEEYKSLYEMYRDRIRPKIVLEIRDLHENNNSSSKSVLLKRLLKKEPKRITDILGTNRWGYQIAPIRIEKIHGHNPASAKEKLQEELREAVKLYDREQGISFIAEDECSVIGKLAYYTNELIRVFVFEEKESQMDYDNIKRKLDDLLE